MCKWKQIDNPEAGIKVPAGQKQQEQAQPAPLDLQQPKTIRR